MKQLQRNENETYVQFMKRVVAAVENDEIGYSKMGDLLFGSGNVYSEDNLRKMYYGISKICGKIEDDELKRYSGYNITNRILCASDFHFPFHLPVEVFEKYRGCVDTLVLCGDLIDLVQISKFKCVRRNTPMEDVIGLRAYLIELIEYLNPKVVIANAGNHEWRFGKYLDNKLENDMSEFLPKTPTDLIFEDGFYHYDHQEKKKTWYEPLTKAFPDKKISYSGTWYNQIGDTIFVHPNAFSSGTLKTSERAMDYFLREGKQFKNLVMAHVHRRASNDIGEISLYECGCCCDVEKNNYRDGSLVSTQKEGYIYLCQDEAGNTIKELTRLEKLN